LDRTRQAPTEIFRTARIARWEIAALRTCAASWRHLHPAALYDSLRLTAVHPPQSDADVPGRSGRVERADAPPLTGRRTQRFLSATSVCVIRGL
jgi:hypothetical protein